MAAKAPQLHPVSTEETRTVSVSFAEMLDSGELLSGTPDIQCSANLTISAAQVTSDVAEINGEQVIAGNAVQFHVAGSVPGLYPIEIVCNTNAGQVVEGVIMLRVRQSKF